MNRNLELEKQIFDVTQESFEQTALAVFKFQYQHSPIYRKFCDYLGRTNPHSIEQIPFLPISFFKTDKIISHNCIEQKVFKSSGTTGKLRSKHYVASLELYETSFTRGYRKCIGNPEDQIIIALLPSYLEQGESSLLYMVDALIKKTNNTLSGYFLEQLKDLPAYINKMRKEFPNKEIIIFGVSYALLDLAELNLDLNDVKIIETGGMKGRRKELTKKELHETLSAGLNVEVVSSEYGMTELLSQGYSVKNQEFITPSWLKVLIRDINDAFSFLTEGKTGGINVVDLANLYSCSFIATQDLGKAYPNYFKIMGRFDNSDIRGCNLLVN